MPPRASSSDSCGETAMTGEHMRSATRRSCKASPVASRATASREVSMPRGRSTGSTTTTPPTPARRMRPRTRGTPSSARAVTTERTMAWSTVHPASSSAIPAARAT